MVRVADSLEITPKITLNLNGLTSKYITLGLMRTSDSNRNQGKINLVEWTLRETNGGFMFYWEIDLVIEQTSSKDTEFDANGVLG